MKKSIIFLLSAFMLLVSTDLLFAQKDIRKRDLRALKQARKEARQMQRAGWDVAPGSLPIDKALERSWKMLLDVDDRGQRKFMDADGNAVAETRSAADLQALELAKLNLAGQLETQIAALIEVSVANQQLTREEAASMTKVVAASKNMIKNTIGNVTPVYKIYREVGRSNVEAQLKIFYPMEEAMTSAKQVVRKKLTEETTILHERLDNILDLK